MSEKSEALRLADALGNLEATGHCSDSVSLTDRSEAIADAAAAELRRLSAENKRFAALVCDYAAEEAPDAIRKIAVDRDRWHTKAQQAEAQRDALLEALAALVLNIDAGGASLDAMRDARAAIKAVEDGK